MLLPVIPCGEHTGVNVVALSRIAKLGLAAATYASQATCDPGCALANGNGCYAENGNMAYHTRRLNAAEERDPYVLAVREAAEIDRLPGTLPLRLHIVGDCRTDAAARLLADAAARYTAKHGMPVWSYTHSWRTIARASWGTIGIRASCETPEDVAEAEARGYLTALVYVAPPEGPRKRRFHVDGLPVVPCPQQSHANVTCVPGPNSTGCGLCWNPNIRTIGFATHGGAKKKAGAAVTRRTEVARAQRNAADVAARLAVAR